MAMRYGTMIRKTFFLIALAFLLCASAEAKIAGDYLESRSADVYTGQCFANGEVGLTGDQAILAWHIRSGSWDGVKLDRFSVVAAVKDRKSTRLNSSHGYTSYADLCL